MRIFLIFLVIFTTFIKSSYAFNYNRKIILTANYDQFSILGDIDYRNRDNNDRDLFHRHYDLGLRYTLDKNLNIAVKYRNVYRKSNNEWDLFEQRPQLQISNSLNYPLVKIRTRIRQEYRIIDGDDFFRTRIRFYAQSNKKFLKLKPFIDNELFYDFKASRYNRNRAEIGLELPKIAKYFTSNIAYRYNSKFRSQTKRWDGEEVIVFTIRIKW